MDDVAVVGGGLAGLVCARRLAVEDVPVTLFEREGDVGGRVRSHRVDGFVLDRGFQVCFPAYPALQRELDLAALDLQRFPPGAILARSGERSVLADPFGDPRALTATLFNREVTVGDKLRVALLRRKLGARDPASFHRGSEADSPAQSIAQYLRSRGFSETFIDNFAAPFFGGITLDRSLETSRYPFEYAFAMLARGGAAVPAAGMGAISQQLGEAAASAGVLVETGTTVESVTEGSDGGVSVTLADEMRSFDAVVVATDAPTARSLTGCDSIPTDGRGCVTQHFSLPETQELGTRGRLICNVDAARPNHVAVTSAVAHGCAPAGHQLLSATFLGTPEASDQELAGMVRDALGSWYPANSFAGLELLRTDRIPFAQFEQPPGFRENLPGVDAPEGQVYLAGEFTEWSSIQGALRSGRLAAERVLTTLER